jgi:MAP/microtubule affinity-regulating kinase
MLESKEEEKWGASSNLSDKYTIGNIIGKGSYAVVRKCNRKEDDQSFAVKVYEKFKLQDPQKRRNV